MIGIKVINKPKSITIECVGHAGFDISGKDIVCAAASVLFINTVNSIEALTDAKVSIEQNNDVITAQITDADDKAKLLIKSMAMGMQEIEKKYTDKYISFKEV